MKLNNIFILFLFLLSLSAKATDNKVILDSANAAYGNGNYVKAIKLYDSIIKSGEESAELYFNLGNAYYKTNNIAFAILYYERAKLLAPEEEDITINLKLANQKTEDKIDVAPQLFLTTWKNSIVDMMSEKGWSKLCILIVIISLFLFIIYIFNSNRTLKQIGFFGGTILIIASIFLFFIAKHKYELTLNSGGAIITSPTVTVTGSPNEKGTKLFILHEGTKVTITEDSGDWMEIKIANGNVGWVLGKSISQI